jgi:aerobic carbon-monoxide dehydrogenase large subunit
VTFSDGSFQVQKTGAQIDLFEVARAMAERSNLPEELSGAWQGIGDVTQRLGTYPYGTQVCELEIDPETGVVTILRYTAIDDVGRAVNPLILHGQTHGGVTQGIGQALCELCYYEPESGQPLATSFMDYAMPRASNTPEFTVGISEVPAPSNRLGVRAGGEGGTTGAPATVANAVMDALSPLGISHLDMPLTSERIWRAIQDAKLKKASVSSA